MNHMMRMFQLRREHTACLLLSDSLSEAAIINKLLPGDIIADTGVILDPEMDCHWHLYGLRRDLLKTWSVEHRKIYLLSSGQLIIGIALWWDENEI